MSAYPTANDVICGRSSLAFNHAGNCHFRELVHQRKEAYIAATTKTDKRKVAIGIVAQVRSLGGRFLKQEADGTWHDTGNKAALTKTQQALREDQKKVLEQMTIADDEPAPNTARTYVPPSQPPAIVVDRNATNANKVPEPFPGIFQQPLSNRDADIAATYLDTLNIKLTEQDRQIFEAQQRHLAAQQPSMQPPMQQPPPPQKGQSLESWTESFFPEFAVASEIPPKKQDSSKHHARIFSRRNSGTRNSELQTGHAPTEWKDPIDHIFGNEGSQLSNFSAMTGFSINKSSGTMAGLSINKSSGTMSVDDSIGTIVGFDEKMEIPTAGSLVNVVARPPPPPAAPTPQQPNRRSILAQMKYKRPDSKSGARGGASANPSVQSSDLSEVTSSMYNMSINSFPVSADSMLSSQPLDRRSIFGDANPAPSRNSLDSGGSIYRESHRSLMSDLSGNPYHTDDLITIFQEMPSLFGKEPQTSNTSSKNPPLDAWKE